MKLRWSKPPRRLFPCEVLFLKKLLQIGSLEYGVAGEVSLRWAAVDLTPVVEEARQRHDLSPIAAVALGRAMAGATLLLRLSARASRRLTLTVSGDGPIGKIVAEVDSEGNLRGLVGEPQVALPEPPEGPSGERKAGLRIAEAVGRGILRVRRELVDGSSYESQVALESGEIGLDLAHFLEQSEQTQSVVLVGVLEGPEGVRAAGGMIVEVMPGAREDAVEQLEENLARIGGVSRTIGRGGLAELRDDGAPRPRAGAHRSPARSASAAVAAARGCSAVSSACRPRTSTRSATTTAASRRSARTAARATSTSEASSRRAEGRRGAGR